MRVKPFKWGKKSQFKIHWNACRKCISFSGWFTLKCSSPTSLPFVPFLTFCSFWIFNVSSVGNSFDSTVRRNSLSVILASWHTQLSVTVTPGELQSSLEAPQVWTWNFEGLFLEVFLLYFFNEEGPYYITDYIVTVNLLKCHLYSKSFIEKAMVLPYSSEKSPYIRVIDILPNIQETQSYLFFGDIFSGYTHKEFKYNLWNCVYFAIYF